MSTGNWIPTGFLELLPGPVYNYMAGMSGRQSAPQD